MAAKKGAKFTRSANFSTYEEELLVTLITKYKKVIECKITDGATIADKNAAWEKLCKEFNCNSGEQYRSVDTLRRKYENIKKRAKQKYATEKMKVMGTGGGPYTQMSMSKVDMEIKEILGSTMTGLSSTLDDDSEFHMEIEDFTLLEPNTEESTSNKAVESDEQKDETEIVNDDGEGSVNYEIITIESSKDGADWSSYTPKMLKKNKSDALRVTPKKRGDDRTGKSLENKLVTWTTAKLELVEFQKELYLQEQKLKLRNIREKHEKEIEREEKEANVRIQALEEEHRLKMEILELQKKKVHNLRLGIIGVFNKKIL